VTRNSLLYRHAKAGKEKCIENSGLEAQRAENEEWGSWGGAASPLPPVMTSGGCNL